MTRKEALKSIAAGAALASFGGSALGKAKQETSMDKNQLKGNVNHSACRWCYQRIPLDELCAAARDLGLKGIDLLGPEEWPVAAKHGLVCSMTTGLNFGIVDGFNDPSLHTALYENYEQLIPMAAGSGIRNVICFSGNRRGLSDEAGLENCARGLDPVVKLAQKHNVILTMELLNSKVDHADYQCDRTGWGVQLCEKVGSEHFKLLYDIYHMQIMEGDVIATIRKYHRYFSHYHTGGVPGRNEINHTQELYYPAIMQAIVDTGFKGFVAQEFVPTADNPIASLREAIGICDV